MLMVSHGRCRHSCRYFAVRASRLRPIDFAYRDFRRSPHAAFQKARRSRSAFGANLSTGDAAQMGRRGVIPATFEYYRPRSLDEAIGLLAEHGEDSRVVAGGHSLIPMM